MHIKIKQEMMLLFSSKRLSIIYTGTILGVILNIKLFMNYFTVGNIQDFILYFLNNMYVVLMLLPMAALIISGGNHKSFSEYMILLRYKNRMQYYMITVCSKIIYGLLYFISVLIIIIITGKVFGFQVSSNEISQQIPLIIAKQCFNVFFYIVFMIVTYRIMLIQIQHAVVAAFITMCIPLINIMLVKCGTDNILQWTLWGNIAYKIHDRINLNYRFNWGYWLLINYVVLYLSSCIYEKRDIVYESS